MSQDEVLTLAAAVESDSQHPLARAIVHAAGERQLTLPATTGFRSEPALGVTAQVDGNQVRVGGPRLLAELGLTEPASADQGATRLHVIRDGLVLGSLVLADEIRPESAQAVTALQSLGIKVAMITGDARSVAEAVGTQLGVDMVLAEVRPEDKAAQVAALQADGERVAMVGDGVNDAPAMANATVGIAMGAGGSDVALETADVALMADDLRALPFAVGLSRAARRIIRQNLWASVGMVAFLIPATLTGFAGIGLAVSLHEGSTLLVVANALRLLAYRDPGRPGPAAHPSAA